MTELKAPRPFLMYNTQGWDLGYVHKTEKRSRFVNIVRGELVEKELDAMIECRTRKGELDPDE
jgi:hypothetical protein